MGWGKIKWPLVWRKLAEKHRDQAMASERQRHQAELEQVKAQIDKLLPKLINLQYIRPGITDRRFRLVVELDERLIHECFVWGNDNAIIEMLADRTSLQIRHELKTLNFSRFKRDQDDVSRYKKRFFAS